MSYDEIVKLVSQGEKIYNLTLRVVYYCRVSTSSDVQLNSLDNQLNYYKDYINKNSNWTLIDGYVDEGITGTRADKRPSFQKMIKDASRHKFDLIITKEVSRFARDLLDSIFYSRKLKDLGVGVFFENQGLNTFDLNSEFILTVMTSIAQDESRKLSSRVKFGHKQAINKGHVLGSSNIIGYKKNNCKLIIDDNEAKFIMMVFQLYATGQYGFYKLAKKLGDLGYYNKTGKLYDKATLERIIRNPKYKGYYRGHTSEIMDYRSKRRTFIPKDKQIIYKSNEDIIPMIVSEKLWDKANSILETRTESYKKNNYWSGGLKYPFSSKIYCKEHNVNFQRVSGRKNVNRPTWCCGIYTKYGINSCCSPIITESDLLNIMKQIMKKIITNEEKIINNLLDIYSKINISNEYEKEISNIEKEIDKIEDKKTKTLDLVWNGYIKKDDLKKQFREFEQDITTLLHKKDELSKQRDLSSHNLTNLNKIFNFIKKEFNDSILEEFIRKFVDEIIVSKNDNDRYKIQLDIYIDLYGTLKYKIKGARHINSKINSELYIDNMNMLSIERKKRIDNKKNTFLCNVYI